MRSALMMTLAVVLLTPLAGCGQTVTGAIEACAAWRPISWSIKDTPETIDGVKGNNARQKAFCK